MSISCQPNDLIEYAKCFRCIPEGMIVEVQILSACVAAGGTTPTEGSFLIQSENSDYIILDDGGRIIIN